MVVLWGLKSLKVEADILTTLPQNLPEVQGLKLLRDAFVGGDELIIGIESKTAGSEALDTVKWVVQALEGEKDLVKSVRWGDTFDQPENAGKLLAWSLVNTAPAKIQELESSTRPENLDLLLEERVESLATSPDPMQIQRIGYDPLNMLGALGDDALLSIAGGGFETVSKDGRFYILFVSPQEKVTSYVQADLWLQKVKALVEDRLAQRQQTEAVDLYYTGEPAFLAETGQGIEKDMRNTIGLTEVLITILFFWMFRSLKPLFFIHLLLLLIMVVTLALSSLIMGSISVMSLGFAAIVLGIVVDYAVLILQEANDHPELKAAELRKKSAPGIIAGALTTSAVFLALWFSGLPGLAHLGTLVALGILVGMCVMLLIVPHFVAGKTYRQKGLRTKPIFSPAAIKIASVSLFLAITGILIFKGLPAYDTGSDALRPLKSEAIEGWNHLQNRLGSLTEASVPIVLEGKAEELTERAQALASYLKKSKAENTILKYSLPEPFLFQEKNQISNAPVLQLFVDRFEQFKVKLEEVGFNEQALFLLRHTTNELKGLLEKGLPVLASESGAAEVLGQFIGDPKSKAGEILGEGEHVVLGSVTLSGSPGTPDKEKLRALHAEVKLLQGVHLTGWESLGMALSDLVKRDVTRMTIPLSLVLLIMLWLTFRNFKDIALSVLMILISLAALLATMSIAGFNWNLASLAAIPLLVGTGIDYVIHVLLSLRRSKNDVALVQSSTNRAVFFSGATTVIGFSSLISAGNKGIMSLGLSCCLGTVWVMVFVLVFVPYWRQSLSKSA